MSDMYKAKYMMLLAHFVYAVYIPVLCVERGRQWE